MTVKRRDFLKTATGAGRFALREGETLPSRDAYSSFTFMR